MDKAVKNTTENEIAIMWGGLTVYFDPGQTKVLSEFQAVSMTNYNPGLVIVEDYVEEPVVEEVAEEVIEEPVNIDVVEEVVEAPVRRRRKAE